MVDPEAGVDAKGYFPTLQTVTPGLSAMQEPPFTVVVLLVADGAGAVLVGWVFLLVSWWDG